VIIARKGDFALGIDMHALNILVTKILIVERDFIVKITSVGNEPIPINHL